ncbi:hypothetical protein AGDE_13646 [Angomonas deanei]|uniref:Uncharacterized protein n=1 Tax=Angomonas deanei TaxID=59799 RepID=A0A7G2CPH3_9TRYP|nr:hypothetical protein AGDE_13646 [Angomonas deanei]CAD2220082.1 hypothetical protein, conserved [Angomonas deanei]|eukprot:EPY21948.1 hypothetical protein AGDE_13646 [Angomonas deanei]
MVARPPLESEEIVEEQRKLQDDERNAVKVRQHKKVDAGCCGSQKRFLRRRKKAEDADAARVTMNKTVLQNHYCPCGPFSDHQGRLHGGGRTDPSSLVRGQNDRAAPHPGGGALPPDIWRK